MDCICFFSSY